MMEGREKELCEGEISLRMAARKGCEGGFFREIERGG